MGKFQKGLVHGFGQKLAYFPTFYFRLGLGRKMCFRYARKRKRVSTVLKQEFEEVKTLEFFPTFYFRQNRPGKCVLRFAKKRKRVSTV